jgi:shikimate dehydrogenase
MFPDISFKPSIPYEGISDKHLLYDLIYNPEKTKFLREGEMRGAKTMNGMEMHRLQADKSWEIWQSVLE